MTQKERMLNGLPYKAWLDGLSEERMECKELIYEYNNLRPSERERKFELIKEILGKTGDYVVIGAGSVVTKDIPDNMIAAGNPCKVIREITEADRDYYYKDKKFDVDDYK